MLFSRMATREFSALLLALLHASSIELGSADGPTTTTTTTTSTLLGRGVVVEGAGRSLVNGVYFASTPHASHTWVDPNQGYYVLKEATSGTQTGLIDVYYNQDFGGWRIAADGQENYLADCLSCTWSSLAAGEDPAPSVSAFGGSGDGSTTASTSSTSPLPPTALLSMCLVSLLCLLA